MEQVHNAMEVLDLMLQPAFCVRDGKIIKVNPAAAAFLIETGTAVETFLHIGAEEYADFKGGCLYLTLSIDGHNLGASVTRIGDMDVFCMEQIETDAYMQAMSLAAQQLRDPLSNVMTIADKLFPEAAADDPKLREQLSIMNRGLFQMIRIIGNMSDAGRYAADTGNRQEIRNITALVDEIFSRAVQLTEHTAVSLKYSGPTDPIYTLADAEKLERMIFNLVSNAIKFSPAGSCIHAVLNRRGNKLYLSISDNGNGIDKNLHGTLFSRYQRTPGLEDSRHGLGLGMVLVRTTAALHGGTVLVDHPQECGSRITVSLSIRQGDATLRSPGLRIDYTGERDHGLIELSDVLPNRLYDPDLTK